MTKAELIERLVDAMIDPWTDAPEDYIGAEPIDLVAAEGYLAELRRDQDDMDLDKDERVPEEATPALYMEAYNCLIRSRQHEAWTLRLTRWLEENNDMALYDNYRPEFTTADVPEIVPVDWLCSAYNMNDFPFETCHRITLGTLIRIGQNSSELDLVEHEYCWLDRKHNALVGTNTPYKDGLADAKAFAEYILSPAGHDCLAFILDSYMDDSDVHNIFGCEKEEVINE